MNTLYNNRFNSTSAVELPSIINQLGSNLTGVEIGVWHGNNMCYLMDNCPDITKMYGIDPYKPYQDWNRYIGKDLVDQAKKSALERLSNFNYYRWHLLCDESENIASTMFQGNDKIDFIFIDGDHSFEMCYKDLNLWYDKVRSGGLFSGHDFSLYGVNRALLKFRQENNIKGFFKVIPNDVWYWIKD